MSKTSGVKDESQKNPPPAETSAGAKEDLLKDPPPSKYRYGAFAIGLSGARHTMKGGDGHAYAGNSGGVSIGGSYLSDQYYVIGSYDIHMGPYEPIRDQQVIVDYTGTGFTFMAGANAQDTSLRTADGSYGFALGLSYLDTIGRSTSRSKKDPADFDPDIKASDDLIRDYKIRVTTLAIIPALFFSWIEPARIKGNTPELLTTRVEGTLLSLGFAMPLLSTYNATYERKARGTTITDERSDRGRLKGYSIILQYWAFLGV